jgi:integrase
MNKDDRWFIRITPEAGSVKTGQYRDVPLHQQIIDLGFLVFVDRHAPGPLFYDATKAKGALSGARTVSGRLSQWLGDLGIIPEGVAPSHGWRHRFKTKGRELGYSDRVVDAICGHAGRTAGDSYGDVTLAAKARVIDAMLRIDVDGNSEKDQR